MKHRDKRGQYVSLQKKVERMVGLALILAVVTLHTASSRAEAEEGLSDTQRQVIELKLALESLEDESIKLQSLFRYGFHYPTG